MQILRVMGIAYKAFHVCKLKPSSMSESPKGPVVLNVTILLEIFYSGHPLCSLRTNGCSFYQPLNFNRIHTIQDSG